MEIVGKRRQRPLVVFVHGFLGSSESFRRFPEDLIAALPVAVDTLHHEYDTHGSNDQRVEDLIAFLLLNGANRPYVVLLAHSMGGLMACDAAVAIMGRHARQNAETGGVRVRAVVAFDSPFFGLGEHVTRAGVRKVSQTVDSMSGILGALSSSASSGAAKTAVTRGSVGAPSVASAAAKASSSSSRATSMWGGLFAVAAVAATAYASSTAVQEAVNQGVRRGVDAVSKHAQFLGPLWKVEGQETRLKRMKEVVDDGEILFRCFFLQTPAPPPTSGYDQTPGSFISPPPAAYSSFFRPVAVPAGPHATIASDEIDAHVNMFDERMGSAYFTLIQGVVDIVSAVERKP